MESGIERFDKSYARFKELLAQAEKAKTFDELSQIEKEIYLVYRRDLAVLLNVMDRDIYLAMDKNRQNISAGTITNAKAAAKVREILSESAETVKKTVKKAAKKTTKKAKKAKK